MESRLMGFEKPIRRVSLSLIILYPLVFAWQGLDFTDMGYLLTGFQQFLSAPAGIWSVLGNWGTFALGWLVSTLSGNVGVIAFKLAFVGVNWLTIWFAYRLTIDQLSEDWQPIILPTLFITMAFITKLTSNWINYNNLTALFYLITAATLFRGLMKNSLLLLFASGAVTAFNLFVRFPNILGLGLVLTIGLWGRINRESIKLVLIKCGVFTLGAGVSVAVTVLLMKLAGHWGYYLRGIQNIFGMATNTESHHSGSVLLHLFIRDHFYAFLGGVLILTTTWLIAVWSLPKHKYVKILTVVAFTLIAYPVLSYGDSWRWLVSGVTYLGLVAGMAFGLKHDRSIFLLCWLGTALVVLVPLGSDMGLRNAGYGSWLAFPLLAILAVRTSDFKTPAVHWRSWIFPLKPLQLGAIYMATALVFFSVVNKIGHTYRDNSNRLLMTHSVDASLLTGVFTTRDRARVVEEVLAELEQHVAQSDDLLAYNEIPTLHYLTNTVPWLGNPWPMLYSPEQIEQMLIQKMEDGRELPVIVRARGNTSTQWWPLASKTLDKSKREDESRQVFAEFEKDNNYQIVWQNDFFEILKRIPPENTPLFTE